MPCPTMAALDEVSQSDGQEIKVSSPILPESEALNDVASQLSTVCVETGSRKRACAIKAKSNRMAAKECLGPALVLERQYMTGGIAAETLGPDSDRHGHRKPYTNTNS